LGDNLHGRHLGIVGALRKISPRSGDRPRRIVIHKVVCYQMSGDSGADMVGLGDFLAVNQENLSLLSVWKKALVQVISLDRH